MSEKDVTDARMMPVPQPSTAPSYQPSRHPSAVYRDQGPYPQAPLSRPPTMRRTSQVDWIVPTRPEERNRDTVSRRLQPTIDIAKKRHFALSAKAKLFGRSLNAAIGLQIVVGALITGLAAVTTGRQTSIMTSVLGAFSTIIGSFLARMRGTSEPDLSKSRAKGYERFLRACEAFLVDFGDDAAREHIDKINAFRQEFEELEGSANAEQKGNNV
ncbi:hypothetical protein AURDEDRAFT_114195 [Auricularia subglabra TFB-10046 SS5]|nr:hypothetical protein AURDEDRAFT_114195 [Auricularia subglabra TFB-10046 SS5]